jgi:hypothetical protein
MMVVLSLSIVTRFALPFFQEKKGALMLFDKADLDRWLDAHRVEC